MNTAPAAAIPRRPAPLLLRLPEPPLTDGRVVIRGLRKADAPALAAAFRDPRIVRRARGRTPSNAADAAGWIEQHEAPRARGRVLHLAAADAPTDRLLGVFRFRVRSEGDRRAEVGGWLSNEAVGGPFEWIALCLRAERLLSPWAFGCLALQRLEALVEVDNPVALRCMRRAGWREEGVLRSFLERDGERVDVVLFSLLPSDRGARLPA